MFVLFTKSVSEYQSVNFSSTKLLLILQGRLLQCEHIKGELVEI